MVDINPDHIFEVPDTPDRIQQSTCPVSSPAARRGIEKQLELHYHREELNLRSQITPSRVNQVEAMQVVCRLHL